MISSPYLVMKIIYNMLWRWSLYLNRCVAASASDTLEAPEDNTPFLLEPILVELERGSSMGPILPSPLVNHLTGCRPDGRGGSGGDISVSVELNSKRFGASRGGVRVLYDTHLPALSLWDGENARTLLAGIFLPNLHGHVIFKNWNLCRVCWWYCKSKNLHIPTPLEVATAISGLPKTSWGV